MKFLKVFSLILTLLVAALLITYVYSGSILKKGITQAGPAIIGVPIDLESIEANPILGKVQVDKLVIHNPQPFKSDYAFKIDDFRFDFDPMSALGNTMHIRELVIDGATVMSDGLTADNHRAILKHIQSLTGPEKKGTQKEPEETEKPKAPGKKLIIDHFSFINSSLIIQMDGEEITKVDFPNIKLDEIGTKGNALTAAEALAQIYTAIAQETTKVLTVNEDVIENIARAKLKKIGINNLEDLKNPEKLLKDPEAVGNLLNALTKPKSGGSGGS